MDYLNKLGRHIKTLREERSLTQAELAEKADVSTSTIGRLEIGEGFLTFNTLVKIADALNVEIEELFIFSKITVENNEKEIILAEINDRLKHLSDIVDLKFILDVVKGYTRTKNAKGQD